MGPSAPYALRYLHCFMSGTGYLPTRPAHESLSGCTPDEVLCLAAPGRECAVYMVRDQKVVLNLTHAQGTLRLTWVNPRTGEWIVSATVRVFQNVDEGDSAAEGELGSQPLRQGRLVHLPPHDEEPDRVLHLRLDAQGT